MKYTVVRQWPTSDCEEDRIFNTEEEAKDFVWESIKEGWKVFMIVEKHVGP
jgi:hypothetical protein